MHLAVLVGADRFEAVASLLDLDKGAAAAVARSSAPPVRWRILSSGSVERSSTEGASWDSIAIDPPVAVTGGVAPSDSVCWLIGRGGVILLTTDGRRFERVAFREAADLVSIRATSARQAAVTTADGRVFSTIDGGASWRLQGFPPPAF